MGFHAAVSALARAAFAVSALAALAAALVSAFDLAMRYFAGSPIAGAYEYVEAAITVAVLLGAPGALYRYRDPAIPPGPAWFGRAGTAAALLVFAAFAAATIYLLIVNLGLNDTGERSVIHGLPIVLISAVSLYSCFALLFLMQLALVADGQGRPPAELALPWALVLGVTAVVGLAAVRGIGGVGTALTSMLVATASTGSSLALPVLVAGALGGAIAALRPSTRIAAIAAPMLLVTLVGLTGEISIAKSALALTFPAFIVAALHAALGAWRGWGGMVDDLIGLGILVLTGVMLAPGLFTPSEFAASIGLVAFGILALIAAILQPAGGVSRRLARGLGHGIGALFALQLFLLLANVAVYAGFGRDAIPPDMIGGPVGFVLCLVLGLAFGAFFSGPIGCMLTVFVVMTVSAKALDPVFMASFVVLTTMAGAALHPWLAGRLAGVAPATVPSFRSAMLAALPPAAAAALIWFIPKVALLLPTAMDF